MYYYACTGMYVYISTSVLLWDIHVVYDIFANLHIDISSNSRLLYRHSIYYAYNMFFHINYLLIMLSRILICVSASAHDVGVFCNNKTNKQKANNLSLPHRRDVADDHVLCRITVSVWCCVMILVCVCWCSTAQVLYLGG